MSPAIRPVHPGGGLQHVTQWTGNTRQDGVAFGIANFKSITEAEITPQRLTILAGANSSGKSSLLQALLFLAQSMQGGAPVINGDLVRLGEPSDVIRDGTKNMTFAFGYRGLVPA